MCGIVGTILRPWKNGFDRKQEDSFFHLLYVDALRGWDSTGVIAVEKDSSFHIAKEAVEATWFIQQIKADPIQRDMWRAGQAYIGHNRKKTVGSIDDESAHPFVVDGRFAMVHNGTLRNHEKLAKAKVDSEALAIVLDKAFHSANQQEALEEVLGKVDGAYALACYSQELHKVWLLRNYERPLSLFETNDAYYFASEAMMASWILSREYEAKDVKYIAIEPHSLFEFDLKKNSHTITKLTPKKVIPPFVGRTVGGTTTTATAIKPPQPTGKDLKKLRKTFLGSNVTFRIQEFVEVNWPRRWQAGESSFHIFGQLQQHLDLSHTITGDIDIRGFGWDDVDKEMTSNRFSGRVESVEINDDTGSLVFYVHSVKPIVRTTEDTALVLKERMEYTTMLSELKDGELLQMAKDEKKVLKQWQIVYIATEMRERANQQRNLLNENSTIVH